MVQEVLIDKQTFDTSSCNRLKWQPNCSAAQDIIVTEEAWPSQLFQVDESSYEASFERIASGATVKHQYSVHAIEGPQYVRTDPAVVYYKPEYGSKDVQV